MYNKCFFTCDGSVYTKQITSLTQRFKYGFIGYYYNDVVRDAFYLAFNNAVDLAKEQGLEDEAYSMLESLQVGEQWDDGACYNYVRVW